MLARPLVYCFLPCLSQSRYLWVIPERESFYRYRERYQNTSYPRRSVLARRQELLSTIRVEIGREVLDLSHPLFCACFLLVPLSRKRIENGGLSCFVSPLVSCTRLELEIESYQFKRDSHQYLGMPSARLYTDLCIGKSFWNNR